MYCRLSDKAQELFDVILTRSIEKGKMTGNDREAKEEYVGPEPLLIC